MHSQTQSPHMRSRAINIYQRNFLLLLSSRFLRRRLLVSYTLNEAKTNLEITQSLRTAKKRLGVKRSGLLKHLLLVHSSALAFRNVNTATTKASTLSFNKVFFSSREIWQSFFPPACTHLFLSVAAFFLFINIEFFKVLFLSIIPYTKMKEKISNSYQSVFFISLENGGGLFGSFKSFAGILCK